MLSSSFVPKNTFLSGTIIDQEKLTFANKHCYEFLADYGPMRNDFRYVKLARFIKKEFFVTMLANLI